MRVDIYNKVRCKIKFILCEESEVGKSPEVRVAFGLPYPNLDDRLFRIIEIYHKE